ncbi:putative PepSY-like beta-lactamase-inhibitor [Gillisia mitskevichiae]|uniref:Putative PepSY-like beta-lactamase-inhibitor n=1 Tax=Gillisia mitskevichiae TaxID=270921 RepID=A0A495PT70_9FLAO|nr:PepSY-like domain-containing protein [Gillisia mitskevichiae]RKS53387.1 putative PepSY-like beta-lactamase-inhibitor [Gillisia mitskevichiae]
MKNLKIAVFALFATAALSAQEIAIDKVPANLNSNFQKEYANATDIEWELDKGNYKVEFDLDKMEKEIWYSKNGEVLKTEMEVAIEDIPTAVAATIKNNYPNYDIDEIELTEENGKKIYEVELEKWFNDDVKMLIAADGSIIK